MTTPQSFAGPTYTYSGDPSTSPKDTVRFLARATGGDKTTGFVSDEEIAWILTQESNVYLAAAMVADTVSAIFGAVRSKTIGPLTINGRDQAASYAQLAKDLRAQASSGGTIDGGHALFTGHDSELFRIGMHDYPGGGLFNVLTANDLIGTEGDGAP